MNLDDRMKSYEECYRQYLPRNLPVIIRVDGRAFHTLTKGFKKPFDQDFIGWMQHTAKALVEQVSNTKMAYTQSDEISLIMWDNASHETEPWFGNNLNKIVSLTASIATMEFNRVSGKIATFDSRAFTIPPNDIANYFVWRQQDAIRNSIQALGQAHFSHKQLNQKSCEGIKEMLKEKGVMWEDLPLHLQRGSVIARYPTQFEIPAGPLKGQTITRMQWDIDRNPPSFNSEKGRVFVESSMLWHKEKDPDRVE